MKQPFIGQQVCINIAQGLSVGSGIITDIQYDCKLYRIDVIVGEFDQHCESNGELWVNEFEITPIIYLLRTSPHNEEFILTYATNDAEIEAIARSYVKEYFNEVNIRVFIDYAKKEVVTHWFANEYEGSKTFYISELTPTNNL